LISFLAFVAAVAVVVRKCRRRNQTCRVCESFTIIGADFCLLASSCYFVTLLNCYSMIVVGKNEGDNSFMKWRRVSSNKSENNSPERNQLRTEKRQSNFKLMSTRGLVAVGLSRPTNYCSTVPNTSLRGGIMVARTLLAAPRVTRCFCLPSHRTSQHER
jgi:hypothetical protein